MIQYNISLFIEPSITETALKALKTVIMPEIEKQAFIDQIHLLNNENWDDLIKSITDSGRFKKLTPNSVIEIVVEE